MAYRFYRVPDRRGFYPNPSGLRSYRPDHPVADRPPRALRPRALRLNHEGHEDKEEDLTIFFELFVLISFPTRLAPTGILFHHPKNSYAEPMSKLWRASVFR